MNKLFTTALAAGALAMTFNASAVEKRVSLYCDVLDAPADAIIVPSELGDNANAAAWHLYPWEGTVGVSADRDAEVGEYGVWITDAARPNWWGGGLNIGLKSNGVSGFDIRDAAENIDEWVFNFRFKTTCDKNFTLSVGPTIPGKKDGNGNGVAPNFVFGANEARQYKYDGTWNIVKIPLTDFIDQYNNEAEGMQEFVNSRWFDVNAFALVGGGDWAVNELDICDMWIGGPLGEDGVNGVEISETVATEYYNLQGLKLAEAPVKGIFVKKEIKANGAVKAVKVVK